MLLNPLIMALLWEALATRKVKLLEHSMRNRYRIRAGCSGDNYVRCNDDIGWTVDDQDAQDVGIYPAGYRNFLNKFSTGKFPGSFSKGVPFQFNADTGDVRISGTLSSLAGLENAIEKKDDKLMDLRQKLPAFQNNGMEVIHRGNPHLYRMVFFIHPEGEGCPLGLGAALIYKRRQNILYKCHCR